MFSDFNIVQLCYLAMDLSIVYFVARILAATVGVILALFIEVGKKG